MGYLIFLFEATFLPHGTETPGLFCFQASWIPNWKLSFSTALPLTFWFSSVLTTDFGASQPPYSSDQFWAVSSRSMWTGEQELKSRFPVGNRWAKLWGEPLFHFRSEGRPTSKIKKVQVFHFLSLSQEYHSFLFWFTHICITSWFCFSGRPSCMIMVHESFQTQA